MSRPPLPTFINTPSNTFADQDQSQPPPGSGAGPNKPSYAKRGKITIVACVPCRRRKTKCDGRRPACSQCIARGGGPCLYDMDDNQRKLTFLRESLESVTEEKNVLESLIVTLQSAPEEQLSHTLRRLRSPGGDANAIARETHAARTAAAQASPAESVSHSEASSAQERPRQVSRLEQLELFVKTITHANSTELEEIQRRLRRKEDVPVILGDIAHKNLLHPLRPQRGDNVTPGLEADYSARASTFGLVKGAAYQESAAPQAQTPLGQSARWTTVTDDLEYVNHLLDVYFAWQHSFFQSFPENLFRRDMASGETKFCSSTLVNAICAAGCLLSSRTRARRDPEDARSAGLDFYEEAVRLLNSDNCASSIPTTAALFLLCHVEGNRGRLSSLWMYSGKSSRMALDLNLHLRIEVRENEMDDETQRQEFARRHAFWGCFISDQVTSFTLGRVPQIPTSAVTIELPPVDDDLDKQPWNAYDTPGPDKPGARSTTFNQCAALSKIVNSTLCMFFAPTRVLSGSLLLDEYTKYVNWSRRLPDIISSIDDAPPHVLCLHMYYHAAVLLLFRPFLKATFTESNLSPRDVCRRSANYISDIFAQHRRMYGLSGLYTFQVHCLLTACTIHIINIPAIASSTYLTAACNSFQDLVTRNEWAVGSLNIIRGLVQKWNIVLPIEAENALYRNDTQMSHFDFTADPQRAVEALVPEPDRTAPTGEPGTRCTPTSHDSTSPPSTVDISSTSSKRPGAPHFSMPSTGLYHQKRQRMSQSQTRLIGENYLFAPFPNQPAPLLGPIHTSEGVQEEGTDGEEGESLVERVSRGFDGLSFDSEDGMFDSYLGWDSGGTVGGQRYGRGM
ncbi:hypothetical protein EJ05DRAFT_501611 [Pseudovirgaria hyperparasitica]|uniref:Zn(2)-C6 fungal-type domain-containing protein n=1 Tax=Pseudovirgaria hyperparasitica TaxID=470096 RepID=A0A6A6W564_9PEZI|nr:uncharacterized protein EJ05DRAFT_501611 [Pseudovirgaria hyperparasitica]KAF2757070.1 hypothetical protein EJ05DRAFT_501611 [Pseudovirgaria hyperparasitica]